MIKKGISTLVDTTLTGAVMNQVGSTLIGPYAGIGQATNVVLASGLLGRTMKSNKKDLKW